MMMSRKIASLFNQVRRPTTRRAAAARPAAPFESLEGRQLFAVSLVSGGGATGGLAVEGAQEPSVSADGNLIAFSSDATNFGVNDTNNARDVFLHNRQTGTTVLVSRTAAGDAGNGISAEPSISTDGAYVSFSSTATNLAGGQPTTNVHKDIFIYNVATGVVTQVSLTSTGGHPSAFSAEPNTNGNGDYVAYTTPSGAPSLVPGTVDDNGLRDVFLWNRTNGTTQLVSTTTTPNTTGNGGSFDPSVSGNGQFVAFRSDASNLLPGDTNSKRDIFVRDMTAGTTVLVSRGVGGVAANGESDSPSISADGNFVVFSSVASNLSPLDTGPTVRDIFVFNRSTNEVTLVSRNAARNGSGSQDSSEPSISTDGRFVAFTSAADNLVAGDTNGVSDIFVFDISTGAMNRVSVSEAGAEGNGASTDANIAPQGLFVAFTSAATNLAGADANGAVTDAFVVSAPDRSAGNTNAPTAAAAATQPQATIGDAFLQFAVTYTDDVDLAPTSFDSGDITVTPPGGGAAIPAELVSSSGSGTSATVTYRIPAPGGVVDDADAGAYTINVQPDQVKDANGNSVAAAGLGPVTVTPAAATGPDLVPTIPDAIPSAVGGSKGRARVVVTNQGDQPVPRGAMMTLQLWLSADGTVDANDRMLVQQNKRFSAKPGQARRFNMRYTYDAPAGGPNYQLLAVADAANAIAESREFNNVGSAAVTVAPPYVELGTAVGAVRPTAAAGRRFTLPVTLTNNGNVPAIGSATFTVVASADDVLGNADDVAVPAVTKNVNVRNGRFRRVPVSFLLPTLAGGNYRFFVTTVFNGNYADAITTNDSDSADNLVAVS